MMYPPGPYVLFQDVLKILQTFHPTTLFADINALHKYELPINSEAEQLLKEICIDAFQSISEEFYESAWVPKLKEWWTKHKTKTEREEKLEKVAAALSLGGKATPEMMPVAERVLQALGL